MTRRKLPTSKETSLPGGHLQNRSGRQLLRGLGVWEGLGVQMGAAGGLGKEQLHWEPPSPAVPSIRLTARSRAGLGARTPWLTPHSPTALEMSLGRAGWAQRAHRGLSVVFTWQSCGKRGFCAFLLCLESEARQGGRGGGIFPAIIRSGFVKAQLSEV